MSLRSRAFIAALSGALLLPAVAEAADAGATTPPSGLGGSLLLAIIGAVVGGGFATTYKTIRNAGVDRNKQVVDTANSAVDVQRKVIDDLQQARAEDREQFKALAGRVTKLEDLLADAREERREALNEARSVRDELRIAKRRIHELETELNDLRDQVGKQTHRSDTP